jgi:5,5'-dehydrodivanillate O-demethylase
VRKLAGLLFAYLGPEPAPLLPNWDVLVREDGRRWGVIEGVVDCNWLQAMENSVDPSHLYWLHGSLGTQHLPRGAERFAALGLPEKYQEQHEFFQVEHGIMKRRITRNGPDAPPLDEQHPLVFPTSLRLVVSLKSVKTQGYVAASTITAEEEKLGYAHSLQFRTPIDDEHLLHFMVNFLPSPTHMRADEDPPFERAPFKDVDGNYRTDYVTAQDALAWEAQGPITDRTVEHLAASDRGVVLLRKLVKEQIEIVRNGGDPLGVIRDPEKNRVIELDIVHEPFGIYRKQVAST